MILIGAVLVAATRRYSVLTAPEGHMHFGFWGGVTIATVGVALAIFGAGWIEEKLEMKGKLAEQIPA